MRELDLSTSIVCSVEDTRLRCGREFHSRPVQVNFYGNPNEEEKYKWGGVSVKGLLFLKKIVVNLIFFCPWTGRKRRFLQYNQPCQSEPPYYHFRFGRGL